ncbi:MAG: MFS transporter [Prevotellaceae bacterium]|nr:MFS transporter [Prevotellaceae bacterium]
MLKRNEALKRLRTAVSLFFFIHGIVFSAWANRIPDVKRALNLSDSALGTVLFSIPIGQMCAMGLSAWLVNKYGSRKMLVTASVLYPLFLVPLGFSDNVFALSIGLFFFGMSSNLYNIASNTQGVNVEDLYSRSILASFHGVWSLGAFLGGFVSMGLIMMNVKPSLHFILVFVTAIIIMFCVRHQLVKADLKPHVATDESRAEEKLPFYKKLDKFLLLLGGMVFFAMICEGCMYDWSGVYFMQVVEAPSELVQLGFVVCMCTMTIGRFLADYFVMRFGAKRLICTSGMLIFIGMALSVAMPDIVFATIGFLLIGFGISATVPVCYSLAGHSEHLKSGTAVAVVTSIGFFGFLVGPPVIGHLAGIISLHWTFGVMSCFGLAIALLSLRLKKR